MKLFSKNRQHSISGERTTTNTKRLGNYIVYAIGEIILVVIGILIAVSINNWNEDNKEEKLLNTYLNDYRNDLNIDSEIIESNLKILDLKREAFNLVISDTMTKESLMKTPLVFSLVLTYSPIKFQTKGYNELKNYVSNTSMTKDTLVQHIVSQHGIYDNLVSNTLDRISDDIDDNINHYKKESPWIGDLLNNQVTDEVTTYFVSADYRNRVALHKVLVYGNLEQFLKAYQTYIEKTLKALDERLEKVDAS